MLNDKKNLISQKRKAVTGLFRVGIIGIGGFAHNHHLALKEMEGEGEVQVVASCDPRLAVLSDEVEALCLDQRSVALYADWKEMIDKHLEDLDWVSIAAPIPFHAQMHGYCVKHGLACYLEKPPSLDPAELERMILTDGKARYATQVGFNHIYQPFRLAIKKRLVSGEFGPLRRVEFLGLWKRSQQYFSRSTWAGRLLMGDCLLLDSCAGNAMSHYLHNLLFFANTSQVFGWASPLELEAELYRANDIEGADAVFARGILDAGVEIRLACTHACETDMEVVERLECEHAFIEIQEAGDWRICWKQGGVEQGQASWPSLKQNLKLYCEYLRGRRERPMTQLEDCRGFVALNAMLYLAGQGIYEIPESFFMTVTAGGGRQARVVRGMSDAARRMVEQGLLPSEQKLDWGYPGGVVGMDRLSQLKTEVLAIAQAQSTRTATISPG